MPDTHDIDIPYQEGFSILAQYPDCRPFTIRYEPSIRRMWMWSSVWDGIYLDEILSHIEAWNGTWEIVYDDNDV